MTLKQLEPSDVLGENYYVYNITSSDYNPSLNGSITITCTLKNVYGTAVASKSLTLYQNGTSKGAQTTNSSGVATWSITCSSSGLQIFRIGAAAIEVYVDNKSELGHTHTKSQITDFPTIPDVSGKIDTAGTGLSKSGTTLNHSNSITALTTAAFKKFKYDAQGHITGTSDVSASDLPTHTHSQYLTEHQDLSDYVTTDDSRLSDARTPKSHTHTKSQITNFPNLGAVALSNDYDDLDNKPTIPTHITDLDAQTDMGVNIFEYDDINQEIWFADSLMYDGNDLTYNDNTIATLGDIPNITGKEDKSNRVTSISSSSTDTQYPSAKCVYDENDDLWNYVQNLDYTQIGGNLVVGDEGIQAQGLEQIINQIISRLMAKSDIGHTHSGYASSSHTHGTWSSTSITDGTLYYNSAIRMCSLKYSRTFSSGSANTMYEWGQLIPSTYRPKYMVSGSGNRNGATITIDSDGYVYGRFALAFSSSTSFYYHIMWHY